MLAVTPDSTPPAFPGFPGFDPQRFVSLMARALRGPEQAMHVYRELLGLEANSRERAIEFVADLAQRQGLNATPLFEGILRFGPTSTARVAAAAYLADQGREDTVLEALEALQPPLLTLTLLTGLLDVLAGRPATADRTRRLVAFGKRFDDEAQYATLTLGAFTGRDVKRAVRRALAESLLRRDAAEAVSWPRESP
jgi:hypothetical protein